ncbi:hypothetical protein FNV43_RR25032 [Rhamnella rubrinervis]|uniref:WPP domain-associated protein n=1 Tax=Rhamnella rubrinervis TaxID=2594499 RepID=A0A8K0GPP9_9ROSA|nr:hypothetical protein FNV43_RR25032 [Rhamnella rubrinervis]
MDEYFGGMDGRLRVSITDSTMMWIVHYAMDKAHEKVKSKEGHFERLNEISKFYELAVMQLDGCMKFVQEETDSYINLESRHEDVLADLSEIRDRLQGRLNEAELAIRDKDRELTERLENELKLRQALETKERELVALRAETKLERTKSEGFEQELFENREGEFCELKNSVDQQVWNIRQKLEPDGKFDSKERDHQDKKIEQMGSDIDVLKETLDVAFGKMQNAISSSEVAPVEQQWVWTIEKDTISIILNGFMKDFQEDLEAKGLKQEKQVPAGWSEFWSGLMNEVRGLRDELEPFVQQEDVQVKSVDSLQTNLVGCKIPNKTGEKQLSEDCSTHGKSRKSSISAEDLDHAEELVEVVSEEDRSHYVAKMRKYHESIIRKKSAEAEELNSLKRETMREKGYSSSRREKDPVSLKIKVQEVVAKLDNLIDWDANVGEYFDDHRNSHEDENFTERSFLNFSAAEKEKLSIETWEDVWENIHKVPCSSNEEELPLKMGLPVQELEEANWKAMMMEETYLILFEGLVNEFYIELCNYDLHRLIREAICKVFLTELVKQWNEDIERNNVEAQTREEICCIVFIEAIKECSSLYDFKLAEYQSLKAENDLLKDTGSTDLYAVDCAIREDVYTILLEEISKELNESLESFFVREEIYQIVFDEIIKSIVNTNNSALLDDQEFKIPDNFLYDSPIASELTENIESFVKEDVCMVFIRETIKEWKLESDACSIDSLIREEIFQFVISVIMKDSFGFQREADSESEDKLSEGMLLDKKLLEPRQVSTEENLTQKLDSIMNCLKVEEDLILTACYEIKEFNSDISQVGLECEELDELKILESKTISTSVSSKLKKVLQRLVKSKAVLGELAFSLGIELNDPDEVYPQRTPIISTSSCLLKENEEKQLNPFDSASPILGFSQLLDFEGTVAEKIEFNILRLDEMEHHLNPLVKLVSSIREKESLYRQAFIRRCQNLKKAEIEVDLLGDQVDLLLGLLEKIYRTLNHSPVLQQYFEVSNILELMKKELNGVFNIHNL